LRSEGRGSRGLAREVEMKLRNEGAVDRWLRGIVGVLLMLSGPAIGGSAWMVEGVGAIMIATALVGWCPLYTLLHVNTRSLKQ
jgi:hypothetical protein